jgi:CO/xanthine dehydrogenase FAD-binding subunit
MIQDYVRAKSKDEVVELVRKGYTILSGGTYLSQHQDNVFGLVDIQNIGLNEISTDNQELLVGAGAKFADIVANNLIPKSFKEVISQEQKQNALNAATIGGYISVYNCSSNIQAWLTCAQAQVQFFPHEGIFKQDVEGFYSTNVKDRLIESINIMLNLNITWKMVSRTPDDFPLLSIFVNHLREKKLITLLGFSNKFLTFQLENDEKVIEKLESVLKISHSQFTNQFISFNYFKKTTRMILTELLHVGDK